MINFQMSFQRNCLSCIVLYLTCIFHSVFQKGVIIFCLCTLLRTVFMTTTELASTFTIYKNSSHNHLDINHSITLSSSPSKTNINCIHYTPSYSLHSPWSSFDSRVQKQHKTNNTTKHAHKNTSLNRRRAAQIKTKKSKNPVTDFGGHTTVGTGKRGKWVELDPASHGSEHFHRAA